jgi:hypothetical protein
MAKYFCLLLSILIYLISFDCKKNPVIPPSSELDSTSHNITWQIDSIGTWQSVLTDAWGTDPNNVYAVGFIYTDTTFTQGTNIMHWDGNQWKPESFWEGNINSVYGFSKNDIWVGGDRIADPYYYVLFGHWDGSTWRAIKLSYTGSIYGFWGTASNNLYAVGLGGMILHFDGNQWTQMYSGSRTLLMSDICGFSNNEIYACGYDQTTGRGVLLFFDGTSWKTLFDNIFNFGDSTNNPAGQITTVWGYDPNHVYIKTGAGTFLGNRFGWTKINIPNDNIYTHHIRGSSYKNIFSVGDFSLLVHWNGKSWHRYEGLSRSPDGDVLLSTWTDGNAAFVVGRSATANGIVYRGTIGN